ncbi:metallophosphoesterase [uncultured Rhodoblastus sp.]|uniref:metallophosphoesterase family protein n=1 Tax=uncultured Rhodoblastus sp. TaxID=543037 RepID=UPI0025FAF90C|nr:metallophosphoesterase [uncultured Rhodoblastus sp.]
MAGSIENGKASRIVTMNSLPDLAKSGLEAAQSSDERETAERYQTAVEKLQQEADKAGSSGVFVAVEDRDASLVQSAVAQAAAGHSPLAAGGLEAQFGDGPTGGDVWGWIKSLWDHVPASARHAIVRPPDTKAGAFPDKGAIAILGDWGTNLYGAPVSAASISKTGGYEMALHLGDIYYSGTPEETKQRFLDVWPGDAAQVSRAINGNHEMYSGGYAYFDQILPAFSQASSYFAVQNEHWLLVGLDTACTDCALDAEQVRWLETVLGARGDRKTILFSHHQPFSRLESKQNPAIGKALAGLFAKKAITAWYWGHEHACVLYDRHPTFDFLGRCVGHGGIPAPRKGEVTSAPIDSRPDGVTWRRLDSSADAPQCLVLDGRNPYVKGEEDKFGPHGYLTLAFDGPKLVERIHLPDGTEIFSGPVP